MKGRNGTTPFLPSTRKGGVQKEMSDQCLTIEQAKQIYDKLETGEMVKLRRLDRQQGQNVLK